MRTVWKYTLTPDVAMRIDGGDPNVVHVGVDPQWLDSPVSADMTNVPTVWVELDPDGGDHITLVFVGTGHSIPWSDARHVGSCITPGALVWHVYEIDRQVRTFRG